MKNIYFIIGVIFIIVYVIKTIKKNNFSVEESFFWISGSLVALILAVFPKIFDKIAVLFGIDYPPSLFFLLCIIFLMFINFRNSQKIVVQQQKIIELAQKFAILERKVKNGKK